VNATSIGMPSAGGAATEAEDFKLLRTSADNWRDVRVVVELVYRHGGTRVVREAESRGLTYVDGIDILVHQGAASFELWTGVEAPLEVMRLGARKRQGESDT
jgi:shikimate dehydrogenase